MVTLICTGKGHGVVEGGRLLELDVNAHLRWHPGDEDRNLLLFINVVATC
jgi:hypothetical protein